MNKLSKYFYTFKNSWQYQLEYRFDTLIRFFIVLVSLVSVFYLWNDVYGQKAVLLGYSKQQMITYYIIVGYLFSSIYASLPIAQEIQDGSLSMYITKPINYLWHHYWLTLAKRTFRLLLGLPILIIVFAVFKNDLYLVADFKSYLILLLTCLGAINILFLFDVILNFLEFWLFQSSSIALISDTIVSFFAGTLIPIFFLPTYIQTIGNFLPFKYTGFFIIDSFLGKNSLTQVLFGVGVQIFWTLFLLFFVKIMWNRGLKKYEAVGN